MSRLKNPTRWAVCLILNQPRTQAVCSRSYSCVWPRIVQRKSMPRVLNPTGITANSDRRLVVRKTRKNHGLIPWNSIFFSLSIALSRPNSAVMSYQTSRFSLDSSIPRHQNSSIDKDKMTEDIPFAFHRVIIALTIDIKKSNHRYTDSLINIQKKNLRNLWNLWLHFILPIPQKCINRDKLK